MDERRNTHRNLLVVVAAVALFISAVGVVALAQEDGGEVFTGCVNQNSGVLKNVAVGSELARPCNDEEVQIRWNQTGPEGPAGSPGPPGPPAQAEPLHLFVDCDAGDTIGAALGQAQAHLGPVNITISGVCEESVNVGRDDVSFQGTQRSDGIHAASTDSPAVLLGGVQRVGFSNMTISGGSGGIHANFGATFVASDITVRDSSLSGIFLQGGSSASVTSCTIADNSGGGVLTLSEGGVVLNDCEITGNSGAGVGGSGTTSVGTSEITNNGGGAGVGPGGILRLSNTLVANNQFAGVGSIGGQLGMDGDTRIVGNDFGVMIDTGAIVYIGRGPVVVEGNRASGFSVAGGSNVRADELIVRNNAGNGISIQDLSTVSVGPAGETAQITDNGGWGIFCGGPPAVAVLGGQGLFNPSNIVFSGNTSGDTNCQ